VLLDGPSEMECFLRHVHIRKHESASCSKYVTSLICKFSLAILDSRHFLRSSGPCTKIIIGSLLKAEFHMISPDICVVTGYLGLNC
jgi:hypothetical protein